MRLARLLLAPALVGGALAVSAGCSPLAHTVPNRVVRGMPPERLLRLFDAENDVSIALDERAQMAEVEEALDRALTRARRAAAAGRRDHQVAAARQRYLAAAQAFINARLRAQNKVILAALAKFELAKAIMVKRNNLDGAQDIKIPEFERQAAQEGAAAKRQLADLSGRKERAVRERVAWETARQGAAASTIGGDATVDEEDPQWEIW